MVPVFSYIYLFVIGTSDVIGHSVLCHKLSDSDSFHVLNTESLGRIASAYLRPLSVSSSLLEGLIDVHHSSQSEAALFVK